MKNGDRVIRRPDAPFNFSDGIDTGTVIGANRYGDYETTVSILRDGLTRRGQKRQPQFYSPEFWTVFRDAEGGRK
jgi:hypothetical protein